MSFIVQTRVQGLPWIDAASPNERAPRHETRAEAEARIAEVRTWDDPMWATAEYRIKRES